jgi:DASH complex subunit DAM1
MRLIEQDAIAAMEALQAKNSAKAREMQIAAAADKTTVTDGDTTFATNVTTATGVSSNKSGIPAKKKAGKPKMTAKEKKERSVRVLFSSVISTHRGTFRCLRLK